MPPKSWTQDIKSRIHKNARIDCIFRQTRPQKSLAPKAITWMKTSVKKIDKY